LFRNSLLGRWTQGRHSRGMLIVVVQVHVKPECIEAFREATIHNATNSVLESGIARFDVLEQADDPTRFVLVEVYRDDAAPAAHKETAHYARWRDTVAPMMASPRTSLKYRDLHLPV
jgi:autoinducer 2-degrading protein